jgi:hypothetical protein
MDEDVVKILKSSAIPILAVFLVLFLFSRRCAHDRVVTQITETTETVVPLPGGSTPPPTAPPAASSVALPDGLTDEYARYQIENDSRFRDAGSVRVSKGEPSSMLSTLAASGAVTVAKDAAGKQTAAITPEGQAKLGTYQDFGDAWEFSTGSRKVDTFTGSKQDPSDRNSWKITFFWSGEASYVGKLAGYGKERKSATATFTRHNDRWSVTDVVF